MQFFQNTFQSLLKSSRSAIYRNGYVLEAKIGRCSFEFPEFIKTQFVNIYLKKISGNGKVIINQIEYIVSSKQEEVISIPFINRISIERSKDSIGEISVLGFSIDENKEKANVSENWKSLITRCGEFKGLKLLSGKLHATEGACIKNGQYISVLETLPAEAYSRKEDDSIIFNTSAEIIKLTLDESINDIKIIVENPFVHRDPPNPVALKPINQKQIGHIQYPGVSNIPKIVKEPVNYNNLIVYDSKTHGINKQHMVSTGKLVKFTVSNGQTWMSLEQGGIFSIPLSSVARENNYICIISAKRITGNGRLYVGFSCGNKSKNYAIIVDSMFNDKNIQMSSFLINSPDDVNKLTLQMQDDCYGSILIQRIILIEDIPTVGRYHLLNSITQNNNATFSYREMSIKESTRKAAHHYAENQDKVIDLESVVECNTFTSRQWFNKTAPYVSGLKLFDKLNLVRNVIRTNDPPNFVMTKAGDITKSAKRIYLDEFKDKSEFKPNELDILKDCKEIVSPSRSNGLLLGSLLNKEIEIQSKPWFVPKLQRTEDQFFLYFEKNEIITKFIVEFWAKSYPTLVVVGSNLDCPNHIKKFSEYLPYSQLINLINNSNAVINLDNNKYESSIKNVCLQLGVPVVSNDFNEQSTLHKYIHCDIVNKNCIINQDDLLNVVNMEKKSEEFKVESFKEKLAKFVGAL